MGRPGGVGTVPRVRVAFVGKGGAGKSALAGTVARTLAATGRPVLALDSDPMPGLAFSLGVPASEAGIPDEAVEPVERHGRATFRLRADLTAEEVVRRYAVSGPDGVRFLQLGKARGPRWDNARQHAAFQQLLDALPLDGWSVIGDLPGGTRQPFQTWGRYARTVLVVVEPTPASILTGRRLARLVHSRARPVVRAVAAKTRAPGDAGQVAAGTGLPVVGAVPLDPAVRAAEESGRSVLDVDPDCAYAVAVRSLVGTLLAEEGT